jgi:hypothetical protein
MAGASPATTASGSRVRTGTPLATATLNNKVQEHNQYVPPTLMRPTTGSAGAGPSPAAVAANAPPVRRALGSTAPGNALAEAGSDDTPQKHMLPAGGRSASTLQAYSTRPSTRHKGTEPSKGLAALSKEQEPKGNLKSISFRDLEAKCGLPLPREGAGASSAEPIQSGAQPSERKPHDTKDRGNQGDAVPRKA